MMKPSTTNWLLDCGWKKVAWPVRCGVGGVVVVVVVARMSVHSLPHDPTIVVNQPTPPTHHLTRSTWKGGGERMMSKTSPEMEQV